MRRLLLLGALCAAASCTGLFLDKGNSYPCDFSEGPDKRDKACLPGDICGTNNLCQKFIYEGPRFEGAPTVPSYGPGSDEGEVLHPLVLDQPVTEISGDLPVSPNWRFFVRQGSGLYQERFGHVLPNTAVLPSMLPLGFGTPAVQTFHESLLRTNVLFKSTTGRLAVGTVGLPNTQAVREEGSTNLASFEGARVIETQVPGISVPVAWGNGSVGVVVSRALDWEYRAWLAGRPKVLDVAALGLGPRLWVFTLEPDGVEVIDTRDAGVSLVATLEPLSVQQGALKTDQATRVISAVRSAMTPMRKDVLSTFQVNVTSEGPALSSPWADCTPCEAGERVELMAPSVRTGAPTVDVVCMRDRRLPSALRVFGSVALTQLDTCLTEELSVPVPFSRVAVSDGGIVHWDSQWGLLVGGLHGEVWWGSSLTDLQPEFLDRVPRDIAPALMGTTPSLAVIADDYLAVQQNEENALEAGELLNGFRRVPLGELGVPENSRLASFVHGVSGWAVDNTGLLVRANLGKTLPAGVRRVQAGPRLVSASEELVRDSIGGEAFTKNDGGLAFFLAADDSLYFVEDPEEYLKAENQGLALGPDLTPEASVPIRSLALERTPLGTDGESTARGYLVTSRNVFSWELGGEPASWSATPLALTVGEPVEVWFDSPRSALGRVGYRDGQIYSLPGGYPLAAALPEGPEGEAPLVFDFENLGGWPVAYASTGLFIAGWPQVDGKLQNRFDDGVNKPMIWTEVTLPDAGTPWQRERPDGGTAKVPRAKAGRLFVAVDPPMDGTQLYRLLLFTDDEVRQVAHHLRFKKK